MTAHTAEPIIEKEHSTDLVGWRRLPLSIVPTRYFSKHSFEHVSQLTLTNGFRVLLAQSLKSLTWSLRPLRNRLLTSLQLILCYSLSWPFSSWLPPHWLLAAWLSARSSVLGLCNNPSPQMLCSVVTLVNSTMKRLRGLQSGSLLWTLDHGPCW